MKTQKRFILVGVLNTLLDTIVFLLLFSVLGLFFANLTASITAMIFSFVVNHYFTFESKDRFRLSQVFTFIATTGVILWVLQPTLIYFILKVTDVLFISKMIAVCVCFCFNYLCYRFIVWPIKENV